MSDVKRIYDFDEGDASMKYVLGGKGANLAEMARLGLPVPPGFTITAQTCIEYIENGGRFPDGLEDDVAEHLATLESRMGKRLGDPEDPLLVSVRSGAAISMPGMMDTVLNLGLSDEAVEGLARQTGNRRFAYDSYRRFIQMFSDVVMGVDKDLFEEAISSMKQARGVKNDTDLTAEDLEELAGQFKEIFAKEVSADAYPALVVDGAMAFPQDPVVQLHLAIEAVFKSWNKKSARDYRRLNKIPEDLGTAVNVQAMVFGNKGETSATGVAFTRDPSTGEKVRYGDFLVNAQGEDVVAGIRTTQPIEQLADVLPEAAEELERVMALLESHYRDMCDIEFTIEQGRLWMLQTRIGKRTARAALKIAVDMVEEGLIDRAEAVRRIDPDQLDQLLHPQFDPSAEYETLTKGLNASPGAAVGEAVFSADDAEAAAHEGRKVILVRWETTPDDLHGMVAAQGILTSHGGKTSHAAVVARGMGKPCVAGAEEIKIDQKAKVAKVGDVTIREGDMISIDGTTGEVILGAVPMVPPKPSEQFATILEWADEFRVLGVRTNADTPEDAVRGREMGAEGIGLCRTEHMFLGDRKDIVQRMILAEDDDAREESLAQLLEVQREDFIGIFDAMDGLPVTVRLLDPPLHEFLDDPRELEVEIVRAEARGEDVSSKRRLLARIDEMVEANPMLGLRGCRLGIMHPEIYKMQVRAITEAACALRKQGKDPRPEIMIPLVSLKAELETLRSETEEVVRSVLESEGCDIQIPIGTMIELPRAAVTADEIAQVADFFSFGTNDLTQTTFGFSRDDIEGKFLPTYLERRIVTRNPFETVDEGVAKLVEMGCVQGRSSNPDLKLGVCGEHGGDPESVHVFHRIGLTYVSCSPFRVPVARLAAAQAALAEEKE
ncbi:MAG: pyruvate, phosphate dikinase [Coriobacteriia bacterium]